MFNYNWQYDPQYSWMYNLQKFVRWESTEAVDDVIWFVNRFLPEIAQNDPDLRKCLEQKKRGGDFQSTTTNDQNNKAMNDNLYKMLNYIRVKDKQEVLEAGKILALIGIQIFTSEEHKETFLKNAEDVKNNFLVQDAKGWRIQSHYLGEGISLNLLKALVEEIRSSNVKEFTHNVIKNKEDIPYSEDIATVYAKEMLAKNFNGLKGSSVVWFLDIMKDIAKQQDVIKADD